MKVGKRRMAESDDSMKAELDREVHTVNRYFTAVMLVALSEFFIRDHHCSLRGIAFCTPGAVDKVGNAPTCFRRVVDLALAFCRLGVGLLCDSP